MAELKGGYLESDDEITEKKPTSLPIYEQELHISFMRDEDFATIYASDTTQITRLDKLCKNNQDMYQVIEETKYGKKYRLNDKGLISLRSKKKEMSQEAKDAASERFKKMWADKSTGNSVSC